MDEFQAAAAQFLPDDPTALREAARNHNLYHMWREIWARSGRVTKEWNPYGLESPQADPMPSMPKGPGPGPGAPCVAQMGKESPMSAGVHGMQPPPPPLSVGMDKAKDPAAAAAFGEPSNKDGGHGIIIMALFSAAIWNSSSASNIRKPRWSYGALLNNRRD